MKTPSEGSRVLLKGDALDTQWLQGTVLIRMSTSTYGVSTGREERYVHADGLCPCTFQDASEQAGLVFQEELLCACLQAAVPRCQATLGLLS